MKETSSSSSMPSTYSWQWPTSSSSWWTVRGTSRCCVKLASTSGCCSAAVRPWVTKTIHCTRRCRGCLRGWLHRPFSQWPSGTDNLFVLFLSRCGYYLPKVNITKKDHPVCVYYVWAQHKHQVVPFNCLSASSLVRSIQTDRRADWWFGWTGWKTFGLRVVLVERQGCHPY